MNDHQPISIAEARKHIGYRKGWRSLLNYLTAKELALGVRFIDRQRGRRRTRYRTTLAAIRCHAPEIVPGALRRDAPHAIEVTKLHEALESLDVKIVEVTDDRIRATVTPRISALSGRVQTLERKAAKKP